MLDITISFSVGAILIREEWDVRFNMSSVYLFTGCFCFFVSFLVNYLMCVACFTFGALVFFVSIFKEDINLLKLSFFPVSNKMNRVRGGMQLPTVIQHVHPSPDSTVGRNRAQLVTDIMSVGLLREPREIPQLCCFGDKNFTLDSCLRSLHRCKQVAFYYLQKILMKIF